MPRLHAQIYPHQLFLCDLQRAAATERNYAHIATIEKRSSARCKTGGIEQASRRARPGIRGRP